MKRIILADDSATARMFIRRCLQIIGLGDAQILEVENGQQALTAAKEKRPDLMLVDLNMPVMDGEALLSWCKASPLLHTVPVIIITSAGNCAKEDQLRQRGAFRVIQKPVSPMQLRDALVSFLDDQPARPVADPANHGTTAARHAMLWAARQALENLAFLEVMEHYNPDLEIPAAELTCARQQVLSPVQGSILLALPNRLLRSLTATLFTQAEDLVSDALMTDTLKELLNTITGRFLSHLLPAPQAFRLGLPEPVAGPLPKHEPESLGWRLMTPGEDLLQLFASGPSLVALCNPGQR